MASPAVAGTAADSATGAANTTSLTVTMPGSISAGEGIFVVVSWDGTGTLTVNTGSSSSGWQKLGQETNSTLCTQACFWQPDAVGGGSDSLTITSSVSERGTAIAKRVSGQSTSITPDWLGQSGAAAADAANGPNVNGTGGSKDYLAITTCTLDTAATVPSAAPSGYTGLETHTGAASSVTSAFAHKQFTGSSEDPGVFTHTSQAWVAATVLIHPAGASAYSLDCQPGSFTVTGTAATTAAGRMVSADPGSYAVTGTAASTVAGRVVSADPGSYTVTGAAATTVATRLISADPGSYTVTGTAATVVAGRVLSADPGTYTITGVTADLVYSGAAAGYSLNAEPGSYTVTGTAASVVAGRVLQADPGSIVMAGAPAGVVAARMIDAAPGSYTLTGAAAALAYSGAAVATVPATLVLVDAAAAASAAISDAGTASVDVTDLATGAAVTIADTTP